MNVGRFVKILVCLKHSLSRMSAVELGGVGTNFHCIDISKSQPNPGSPIAFIWSDVSPDRTDVGATS
jgi:hypothetical protein